MKVGDVTVKFQPSGKVVHVASGAPMREATARAGVLLDFPCGGQGTCGKCRVKFVMDAPAPLAVERALLSVAELDAGVRLACATHIEKSCTVDIPETSLLASTYQILGGSPEEHKAAVDPPVRKQYVTLMPPSRLDDEPDVERLQRMLGSIRVNAATLRSLPARLRETGFTGTAVLCGDRLIAFEAGDTTETCYAAAFDIGTTTLVGVLMNLSDGRELASTSRINPQTSYGDDVLSRILFARDMVGGLKQIHGEIVAAVNAMLHELAEKSGIQTDSIYGVTFAGNTTMQTLLLGVDPSPLGEAPFVAAARAGQTLCAADLGLHIHPQGDVYVFPIIGGFVGGDTVAGILATALDRDAGPTLLVDIGTNGEMVLCHEGRMLAASCAAGPAFEGARISHGMRAAIGAIEKITLGNDVEFSTIGGSRAVGICGSALIDLAAELLNKGILISQGMLLSADALPHAFPPTLAERVIDTDEGPAFVIASTDETHTGDPVVLLQRDVRELQLATAAIKSGIAIVLRRAGLSVGELKRLFVAGAFGNYIRCDNAQRIGLLPDALDASRIFFMGNTSLAGARLAALSLRARTRAEALAQEIEHVDLSQDVNFQNEYVEAMFFPDPEA